MTINQFHGIDFDTILHCINGFRFSVYLRTGRYTTTEPMIVVKLRVESSLKYRLLQGQHSHTKINLIFQLEQKRRISSSLLISVLLHSSSSFLFQILFQLIDLGVSSPSRSITTSMIVRMEWHMLHVPRIRLPHSRKLKPKRKSRSTRFTFQWVKANRISPPFPVPPRSSLLPDTYSSAKAPPISLRSSPKVQRNRITSTLAFPLPGKPLSFKMKMISFIVHFPIALPMPSKNVLQNRSTLYLQKSRLHGTRPRQI